MFESALSKDHFDIHFTSKNQTYFFVTAKKVGKTQLTSKLDSIMVLPYYVDFSMINDKLVFVSYIYSDEKIKYVF